MSRSSSSTYKVPSTLKHALPWSHLTRSKIRWLGTKISILTLQTRKMKYSAWNIMAPNHPRISGCADKCFTTSWVEAGREEEGRLWQQPWFIELANSQGINAPIMANFKLHPNTARVMPSPRRVGWREGEGQIALGPRYSCNRFSTKYELMDSLYLADFMKGSALTKYWERPHCFRCHTSQQKVLNPIPYFLWLISELPAPTRQQPKWILPRLAALRILQITGPALFLLFHPASKIIGLKKKKKVCPFYGCLR